MVDILRLNSRPNEYDWTLLFGTNFTKGLWTRDWNLVEIIFVQIKILLIRTSHKFAHATRAELSWHVQDCDMIW